MKSIIKVDVPEYQIGQEVSIYFKDTMMIKGVVQEPKTGRWIDVESLDSALWYVCSECGETDFYRPNYCPDCGAKMESEEI